MKNVFLIFLFIFFRHESNAQVVHHFPHDSATWGQFNGFWGNGVYGNTVFYSASGDSTIGNSDYIKIIQSDSLGDLPFLFALIREDSTNKVWVKFQYQFCDTSEFILYDFNLSVGDSMNVIRDPYSPTITHLIILDSITTVLLNSSESRKCYYFSLDCGSNFMGGNEMVWIEGIGSTGGLFYPPGECLIDGINWLTCFHQHDSLKYSSGTVCNLILGTSEIDKDFSISVYPNLVTNNFRVTVTDVKSNAAISIYNIIGQQQFHSLLKPKNNMIDETISLRNYSAGIYIVSVTVNGENFMRKIVKQ